MYAAFFNCLTDCAFQTDRESGNRLLRLNSNQIGEIYSFNYLLLSYDLMIQAWLGWGLSS